MAEVKLRLDCKAALGEGPVCLESGIVHFIDIKGCTLNTFDPSTCEHQVVDTWRKEPVGCMVPVQAGALPNSSGDMLVALKDAIYAVNLDKGGDSWQEVAAVPPSHLGPSFRFNDGKVDPLGRFWAGTMNLEVHKNRDAEKKGRLYALQRKAGKGLGSSKAEEGDGDSGSLELVEKLSDIRNSNGMEWDGTKMFFIDSLANCVDVLDYDAESGAISNRRVVVRIPPEQGVPDGMTIDSGGRLWVALWGGGAVVQYDAETGRQVLRVKMPCMYPTSCAFGGNDLSELYVTTAGIPDDIDMTSIHSGGLFSIHAPGARGLGFARKFS